MYNSAGSESGSFLDAETEEGVVLAHSRSRIGNEIFAIGGIYHKRHKKHKEEKMNAFELK